MKEDAPTNNAGSGNIAGLGVGPKGEPGYSKSTVLKRNSIFAVAETEGTVETPLRNGKKLKISKKTAEKLDEHFSSMDPKKRRISEALTYRDAGSLLRTITKLR